MEARTNCIYGQLLADLCLPEDSRVTAHQHRHVRRNPPRTTYTNTFRGLTPRILLVSSKALFTLTSSPTQSGMLCFVSLP